MCNFLKKQRNLNWIITTTVVNFSIIYGNIILKSFIIFWTSVSLLRFLKNACTIWLCIWLHAVSSLSSSPTSYLQSRSIGTFFRRTRSRYSVIVIVHCLSPLPYNYWGFPNKCNFLKNCCLNYVCKSYSGTGFLKGGTQK